MLSREFEALERYTGELEALRLYPEVRQERDTLAQEVPRLRAEVGHLGEELKSSVSAAKKLRSDLTRKEKEAKELAARLGEARAELTTLRDFKAKLPDGTWLGLEETRKLFLQAEEEEVQRKASERLAELEKDLQARMPGLVQQRLLEVLRSREWPLEIEEAISSRAGKVADGILRDRGRWPRWFREHYLREARDALAQALDSEFETRVQREVERRLDSLKGNEWAKYVAKKVRALSASLKDAVRELQGTWSFPCDRCQRRLALDIGPAEIGALLSGGTAVMSCNACLDFAPFPLPPGTIPHQVSSVSLAELLQAYMGKVPSAE